MFLTVIPTSAVLWLPLLVVSAFAAFSHGAGAERHVVGRWWEAASGTRH